MTVSPYFILVVLALIVVTVPLRRWLRRRRYAQLLEECLVRQPDHEKEHAAAHGGQFTPALRVENVIRRMKRKIHQAGLPGLDDAELRRRASEALCQRR